MDAFIGDVCRCDHSNQNLMVSNIGMGDTEKFMSRYIMTEIIMIIDIITV